MVVFNLKKWYDYLNYRIKVIGVGMKKYKLSLLAGIMVVLLMLGGCGTPFHEMTSEEEELIIKYAAHIIAKYNVYQKDGMTGVLPKEENSEMESETETENSAEQDTQNPSGDGEGGTQDTEKPKPSIAEQLGYKGLSIEHIKSETMDTYKENAGFSIDAPEGKTLYVMTFEMKNTSDAPVEIDNITLNPAFKLVGEKETIKAEVTILNTDLSTYLGEVGVGEMVQAVLVFEVSEADVEKVSDYELKVTVKK